MKFSEVVDKWNDSADEYNQWDTLSDQEKAEHTLAMAAELCIEIGKGGAGMAGKIWCERCACAIRS